MRTTLKIMKMLNQDQKTKRKIDNIRKNKKKNGFKNVIKNNLRKIKNVIRKQIDQHECI